METSTKQPRSNRIREGSRGTAAVAASVSPRRRLLVLVSCVWLISGASPALAQNGGGGENELVVLTGRVQVSEDETVGGVVIFDGPARVDGVVEGDVVAFNGRITVTGTVEGDVVAFNGRAVVEQGAQIGGDVESRTRALVSPGADVQGEVGGLDFRFVDDAIAAARFGVWLAISVSALLLALVFVLLFPRGADSVALAGVSRTGASIGWGVALFFGIPIVSVLLLVTLVGIPLGIGLLLAIAPLYSLGYTIAAYFLGRRIVGPPRSRVLAALAGVAILRAVALVPILGGLTWFVATVFGLGLLAVAARGRRGPEPTPQLA
jgi:hypothetical protein